MLEADLQHSEEQNNALNRIERSRQMLTKCACGVFSEVMRRDSVVSCSSPRAGLGFCSCLLADTKTSSARNLLRRRCLPWCTSCADVAILHSSAGVLLLDVFAPICQFGECCMVSARNSNSHAAQCLYVVVEQRTLEGGLGGLSTFLLVSCLGGVAGGWAHDVHGLRCAADEIRRLRWQLFLDEFVTSMRREEYNEARRLRCLFLWFTCCVHLLVCRLCTFG